MKRSSEYGKRIKKQFNEWVRKYGKPATDEPTDPIEQMVVGILSECTSIHKADSHFRKILGQMVDLNELRVTPSKELAGLLDGTIPRAQNKAQRIVAALNEVRKRQDSLALDFLKQRGRREARDYLESLDGMSRAAAASVVLYSLGGHAIPVDELALYILRKDELIDESVEIPEVQSFLERQISATDARVFAELLNRYVISKSARVDVENIEELLSPPKPEPVVEKKAAKAAAPPEKKEKQEKQEKKESATAAKSAKRAAAGPTGKKPGRKSVKTTKPTARRKKK